MAYCCVYGIDTCIQFECNVCCEGIVCKSNAQLVLCGNGENNVAEFEYSEICSQLQSLAVERKTFDHGSNVQVFNFEFSDSSGNFLYLCNKILHKVDAQFFRNVCKTVEVYGRTVQFECNFDAVNIQVQHVAENSDLGLQDACSSGAYRCLNKHVLVAIQHNVAGNVVGIVVYRQCHSQVDVVVFCIQQLAYCGNVSFCNVCHVDERFGIADFFHCETFCGGNYSGEFSYGNGDIVEFEAVFRSGQYDCCIQIQFVKLKRDFHVVFRFCCGYVFECCQNVVDADGEFRNLNRIAQKRFDKVDESVNICDIELEVGFAQTCIKNVV